MTHRVTATPDPPPGVSPDPLLHFASGLVFGQDTVFGPISAPVVAVVLRPARTLVHAVRADRQVEYRIYRVITSPSALEGDLVEVRPTPPSLGSPPRPLDIPLDHVALLNAQGSPLTRVIPLLSEHEETVDIDVLTNSVEDRALLIPAAALVAGAYTFTWTIDRQRYRSPVVDDTTHYRATVVVTPVLLTGG